MKEIVIQKSFYDNFLEGRKIDVLELLSDEDLEKAINEIDIIEKSKPWTNAGKFLVHGINKNGKKYSAWKTADQLKAEQKKRQSKKLEENFTTKKGDEISFMNNGEMKHGTVEAIGPHGEISVNVGGKNYQTTSKNIKRLAPFTGRKAKDSKTFKAAEYKKVFDDESINTSDKGIDNAIKEVENLPIMKAHPEFRMQLENDLKKADAEPRTYEKYRISGSGATAVYTPERQKIHQEIMEEILTEAKIKAAKPKDGEMPTFQILGGRGGSGKSTFERSKNPDTGVYSKDNVISVDPDDLKERLAKRDPGGWKGWKAAAYHEESSDLSKMIMIAALQHKCNIVMDITMSNADVQINELKLAKSLGYKTGAYYMHVPKQESFRRAMTRYLQSAEEKVPDLDAAGNKQYDDKGNVKTKPKEDYTGRLVPPKILLSMTENEANFDKVKEFADDWSMFDNFVPFKNKKTGKKNNAEKIARKGE